MPGTRTPAMPVGNQNSKGSHVRLTVYALQAYTRSHNPERGNKKTKLQSWGEKGDEPILQVEEQEKTEEEEEQEDEKADLLVISK